jgi:hypothetical protein
MIVISPLHRVLSSKVLLGPRVLPQPWSLGDRHCRNGIAESKVGCVLPLTQGSLVVTLFDQVSFFSENALPVIKSIKELG